MTVQYTYMDYLAHQPGGLTDAAFAADPHQSIRARNWFKVNWNLGARLCWITRSPHKLEIQLPFLRFSLPVAMHWATLIT
jgi:outer membrane receptor for Fe3+-dicitrate